MSLSVRDIFERAKRSLAAGDGAAAAEDARMILEVAPEAWGALHLLGMAERRNGRTEASRQAFEAALALAPDNPEVHKQYAGLLNDLGEILAARDHYRRTVELRPTDAEAWLQLSLAEHATGSPARAREAVETVVRVAPDNAHAWTMLGWSRHADGDGEAAAEAFEKALALQPNDPLVVRALAELETDRGGDALALFARAAALNPRDGLTAFGHAVALRASGDVEAGQKALEAIAAAAPDWLPPRLALARLAIADGRPDQAKQGFVRALTARPRDLDLWTAYLQTLAKMEDYPTILSTVAETRRRLGELPVLDSYEAVALDETGEHERADAILQRLDEAAPNAAIAEMRLRNLLRTGRIDVAEKRAAEGVHQHGGQALWAYLATAWRLLGDPRWTWLEAPEFVRAMEVEDGAELAAEAAPVLRKLHTWRAPPLGQTIRGGSQTEGRLFLRREPELQRLTAALKRTVESYAAGLPPPDPDHPLLSRPRSPVRFTGSWSVRLSSGGLHVNHFHPDGWLSSAFYVALPPPASEQTTEGWLAIGEPPVELGLGLEPYALIEPRPGRLALFPSYTWHGTRPFPAGERLTVAFDVTTG